MRGYVRLDDSIDEHPRVVELEAAAAWAFVRSIAYCARNLTDGFLPSTIAHRISDQCGGRAGILGALENAGLWIQVDHFTFQVRDYLDYQQSRADVLAVRETRSEAGRRGGVASGKARRQAATKQTVEDPFAFASSKTEAEQEQEQERRTRTRAKPSPTGTASPSPTQHLVAFAVDESRRLNIVLPSRTKGHLSRVLKELHDDGMPDAVLRSSLTSLLERGRPPSALPDIARDLQRKPVDPDDLPLGGLRRLTPADQGREWPETA